MSKYVLCSRNNAEFGRPHDYCANPIYTPNRLNWCDEHLKNLPWWPAAQKEWPLRYAFATKKTGHNGLNPDGPRYKAIGNSMAVPVMAWIGRRIQEVESIC